MELNFSPRLFPLTPLEATPGRGGSDYKVIEGQALAEIWRYGAFSVEREDGRTRKLIKEDMRNLEALLQIARKSTDHTTLTSLMRAPDDVAELLGNPGHVPRWPLSAKWQVFREFIAYNASSSDEEQELVNAVDARLDHRDQAPWYLSDTTPGGFPAKSAGSGGSVDIVDLLAISHAAGRRKSGGHSIRDHVLVLVLCWSGLRWEEIVTLRWEDIVWDHDPEDGRFPAWANCHRRGEDILLPIYAKATTALLTFYQQIKQISDRTPTGEIFTSLRYPYEPLSARQAKAILDQALETAELKGERIYDIRAAFASYLKTIQGCSEVELVKILGYDHPDRITELLLSLKASGLSEKVRNIEAAKAAVLLPQPEPIAVDEKTDVVTTEPTREF